MDGEPHIEDNYSGPNGPGGGFNDPGAAKLGGKEYEP
jgi:hypothetical protein